MRGNAMYNTRQKELILECLKNNNEMQMTAIEIFEKLCTQKSKVGMATIYRNLAVLVKEGKVKKFDIAAIASYQYVLNVAECNKHYHLKCIKCNKLYHVDLPELNSINKLIEEVNEFCIDNQKTILYGKCKEC